MQNLEEIIVRQKEYFQSGKTLPIATRIAHLKRLYEEIRNREEDICKALYADLGKSDTESYMGEIGMALAEIRYLIKHVKKWSRARKVKTPLAQFSAKSYVLPTPKGNVLIMSPWNYPFLLTIDPLATAIAAGNTAVVKPSAYSSATSTLLKEMLEQVKH